MFLKNLPLKFSKIIIDNSEFEENPWKNIWVRVKYQKRSRFSTSNFTKNQPRSVSFHGIANFREKTLWRNTFEWLILMFSHCYSNTEVTATKKKNFFVGIHFLPTHILDSLQDKIKTNCT